MEMSNLLLPDQNVLFEIFNDVIIKSAKELNDIRFQIIPSKDEIMFILMNAILDEHKFNKYFLRAMKKLLEGTSWGISKYSFNKGVITYIFIYFSPLSEIKKNLSYIYKYLSYEDIKADCNLNQTLNETICLSNEFWKEKLVTDLNGSSDLELINYDIVNYEQAVINHNRVLACGGNRRRQLGVDSSDESVFTPMFVRIPEKITKVIPTRTKTIFKNDQYWGSGENIYKMSEYLTVPTKYQFNVINTEGRLTDYSNYITDVFLFNSFKVKSLFAQEPINVSNIENYVNFEQPDIILALDSYHTLFYLYNENEVGKTLFLHNKEDQKYLNTLVPIMDHVKTVRTGYNWAFVLSDTNELYGVGYALSGQFGLGGESCCPIIYADLMSLDIGIDVKDIVCGGNHTLLLDTSGMIWATGNNFQGQLGIGNELSDANKELLENTSQQYKVLRDLNQIIYSFTPVDYLPKMEKISCGELFSVALDEDGQIWSTGSNNYGQLGLGHFHDMNRFTKVATDVKFIDVVCGRYHVLALDENNDVYVWGDNQVGQLGIEGVESLANPSRLLLDYKIKSIDSSFLAATSFFTILY